MVCNTESLRFMHSLPFHPHQGPRRRRPRVLEKHPSRGAHEAGWQHFPGLIPFPSPVDSVLTCVPTPCTPINAPAACALRVLENTLQASPMPEVCNNLLACISAFPRRSRRFLHLIPFCSLTAGALRVLEKHPSHGAHEAGWQHFPGRIPFPSPVDSVLTCVPYPCTPINAPAAGALRVLEKHRSNRVHQDILQCPHVRHLSTLSALLCLFCD